MNELFYNCENLKQIDLSYFDTRNVINMSGIFYGCKNLEYIDLKTFYTNKVTNLNNMFHSCKNLKEINFCNFYTKNVIDMSYMFLGCECLQKIDLSNFDTKNVLDMSGLFYGCQNIKEIDLSSFNTEKVINMSGLFYGCKELKSINISSFQTKNVINVNGLFYDCKNLEFIDLSNFDFKKVTNMRSMFKGCEILKDIKLPNLDNNNIIDKSYMFQGCKSLTNSNLISIIKPKDEEIPYIFLDCGILKNIDFSFYSEHNNNYSWEYVIKFESKIKTNNNKNYLINKIKSLEFLNKEGDIIKFKNKIIVTYDNKQYVFNLIIDNKNNDFTFIEYDINDIKSLKEIYDNLISNDNKNIYLIGISFNDNDNDNENIKYSEINKLSDLYNIKQFCISSKNDNDIKNIFNKLMLDIGKNELSSKDKDLYKVIFFPCSLRIVGKTSLMKKIKGNSFSDSICTAFGLNWYFKNIHLKSGKEITIQLYDCGGVEIFRDFAFSYLEECDCAILVFEVSDKESFNDIKKVNNEWKDKFKNIKLFYLIGNKIDLTINNENERKVSIEEALKLAKENNWRYFETSCKENIGIAEFNIDLINEIIKIKKEKN